MDDYALERANERAWEQDTDRAMKREDEAWRELIDEARRQKEAEADVPDAGLPG